MKYEKKPIDVKTAYHLDSQWSNKLDKLGKLNDQIKQLKEEADILKDGIKEEFSDKGVIVGDFYGATFKFTEGTPSKVITKDMIGQKLKGRSGSISMTVQEL